MMVFAQITFLYAANHVAAFMLGGSCSLLCALIFLVYGIASLNAPKPQPPQAIVVKSDTPLEQFFGAGVPKAEFFADLESTLAEVMHQRRYDRAITFKKGQMLIKELLVNALPELPENIDERMVLIHQLYHDTGHNDWALQMEGLVPHLEQYSFSLLARGIASRTRLKKRICVYVKRILYVCTLRYYCYVAILIFVIVTSTCSRYNSSSSRPLSSFYLYR